jgi:hypothetical protein
MKLDGRGLEPLWYVVDTGMGAKCQHPDGCERAWYIEGLCKYHHDMKLYQEEHIARAPS